MQLRKVKLWVLIVLMLTGAISTVFSAQLDADIQPVYNTPVRDNGMGQTTVSIVQSDKERAEAISNEEVRAMVRRAIDDAGGFQDIVHDRDVVVVKPNLVMWRDSVLPQGKGYPLSPEVNGVTTDWRITKAVVEYVREYNPHGIVYVMEGSITPTIATMQKLKYTHEYIPGVDRFIAIEDESNQTGGPDTQVVSVDISRGLYRTSYLVNKILKNADVVISVPCLKHHFRVVTTGGVKNIAIGAVPANIYGTFFPQSNWRVKMVNHSSLDLHRWIHDYYMCRPVHFVVMDGLQGLQNGPIPSFERFGTTAIENEQKNMRLIIAGKDAIAVDTIATLVMGWDPNAIEYLRLLHDDQQGTMDIRNIDVVGHDVHTVQKKFVGVTPTAGCGEGITDFTAPVVQIKRAVWKKGKLMISLNVDSDTAKIKITLDGTYIKHGIKDRFSNIVVDVGLLTAGSHEVAVYAYDAFLNCSVHTIAIKV